MAFTWNETHTPSYDSWRYEKEYAYGHRKTGTVGIVKMTGYPRIRYGVFAEAWSQSSPTRYTKVMDRTGTLFTYKGAKKRADFWKKELDKLG